MGRALVLTALFVLAVTIAYFTTPDPPGPWPQPQETHMDESKLDPEVVRSLSELYGRIYAGSLAGGAEPDACHVLAVQAMDAVVLAARPIALVETKILENP